MVSSGLLENFHMGCALADRSTPLVPEKKNEQKLETDIF
jgi:hypothetical protein